MKSCQNPFLIFTTIKNYFIGLSMNYDGKKFKPIVTSNNSVVGENIIFKYDQENEILTCSYHGGKIRAGHLMGVVDESGKVDMRYHQILDDGSIQTGVCFTTPEILDDGRIRLHEEWQWTSGDLSKGSSILEQVD